MTRVVGGRALRLAGLSAFLLILAEPPFYVLPLAFLALVPLAVALGSLPAGARGRGQASVVGLLFGVIFWGVSLAWVPLNVGAVFAWAVPGYLLLLVLLGGLSALFGWTVHTLVTRRRISLALAFPLAWVGLEWIRGHFPFGLSFPWLGLAPSLARWPGLLGLAEWTGESGVAFWLAAVSALVAQRLLGADRAGGQGAGGMEPGGVSPWRPPVYAVWAGLGALAVGPALVGVLRARGLPLRPGPMVVVVGTRVPRALRTQPLEGAREALRQIGLALATDSTVGVPDLVLLPEAVLPLPMGDGAAEPFRRELEQTAERREAPVVFGALARNAREGKGVGVTNSVFLTPPVGEEVQRYDKVRLVPGMEAGRYDPGVSGVTFLWGEWRYGPLLCYESLFGDLARQARLAGAQVLLNLTSDIWFGSQGSALGSLFLRQHPAHLILRAVETRMPIARAANGGYSLFLDPTGESVSAQLSPAGGILRARLSVTEGRTLFVRFGDLLGPTCAALSLLALLGGIPRRGPAAGDLRDAVPHA